jgi:hypothetical protein
MPDEVLEKDIMYLFEFFKSTLSLQEIVWIYQKRFNSLKTHAGLTRSRLLSTMADAEVTRCDRYPHLNIFRVV